MEFDEEEWSPLDYARHHGLCKPYYDEVTYGGSLPVLTTDNFNQDLEDLSNASVTNSVNALTRERLAMSRDAALLLKSLQEWQEAPPADSITADRYRWVYGLKQELPILQTDNELDLLNFGDATMPDLSHVNIPFEVVHEDRDEGFEWPAKYLTYQAQCEEQINAERLIVSRDVLLQLQDAVRDSFTSQDLVQIESESLPYRSVGETLTPSDIAKSVESTVSTTNPTSTSTVTTAGTLHTIVTCEPSATCL
jgi:hypothetical protein